MSINHFIIIILVLFSMQESGEAMVTMSLSNEQKNSDNDCEYSFIQLLLYM